MDYRAVVNEENWANCPFKRKLYFRLELKKWLPLFYSDVIIKILAFL